MKLESLLPQIQMKQNKSLETPVYSVTLFEGSWGVSKKANTGITRLTIRAIGLINIFTKST